MRALSCLCVVLAGCGASVAPDDPVDSGSGAVIADTAVSGLADATEPIATDATPRPIIDAPTSPFKVTRFRVCAALDQVIIDTSEPVAPVADATKFIRISYFGSSSVLCPDVQDANSYSGENAFFARCGRIYRYNELAIAISEGIYSTSGKALAAKVYRIDLGGLGPECVYYKA